MIIRKMTKKDISSAVAVDDKAFNKPWSDTSFADEIGKDYAHYFVCQDETEIIGYVGIWCLYETAELIRIAVNPSRQQKGVGKLLMTEILNCARDCGCERMLLEERCTNTPAQSLYRKFGFSEISVRKGYYDGEDASIMEKKLV